MRKSTIAAIIVTLTLALTTTAAPRRDRETPRNPEPPLTRIIRVIKHLITTGGPSIPIP